MTQQQTKNRLSYLKRKRSAMITECRKAGKPLPAEYQTLTHDITVCEMNLVNE